MSEAVIRKAVSDIKGGKWFGPVSMAVAYCPLRPSHFHGSRHFVYTQFHRQYV
jgi:hypothetical protein